MITENNFQIESAVVTDRGLSEKRPQNEDSYLELNERGLFAVADGVGGAQAGDVASQMAVEILAEAFVNLQKNGDAEETMKIAIERANEAIFRMSHDLPQLSSMATTMVALHIAGNIATIGHVGDSRLYRLDGTGSFYRETQDHSMVEEEVRAGRMTAAQAANHPSRNIISRALGADVTVEVDMKTIMFEPQTTFLLCSDGITRHIEDVELREILLSNENPSNLVQKMKEICYERGAEDNLTAVIARVTDKVAIRASTNGKGESKAADFEEATVAAPRAPIEMSVDSGNAVVIEQETPTEPLQAPDAETINEPTAAIASTTENKDSLSLQPNETSQKVTVPVATQKNVVEAVSKTRPAAEKSGTSGLGKFLSSLLLLLIGGALGAGAYYFWSQNYRGPVIQTQMTQPTPSPMPSVPFSAFEGSRRSVDRNPQGYIETSVMPPSKAEDFYLLGRAYLLTGKYPEAKKAFEEAKNRLAQADEVNNKMLANEISVGMAIINDPFAQRALEKDLIASYPNANTTSNVNGLSNSSSPNTNMAFGTQNFNSANSSGR